MAARLRAFETVSQAAQDFSAEIEAAVTDSENFAKDRSNHIGHDILQEVTKTGSYTVEAVYLQRPTVLIYNSGSGGTITIPKHANAPAPVGAVLYLFQADAGAITVAPVDGDVTVVAAGALTSTGKNSLVTCRKLGVNLWHISLDVVGTSTNTIPTPVTNPTYTTLPEITYAATTAGSVLTMVPGVTDVSTTKTYRWGYRDDISAGGPFEDYIQPADTDTTYTTNNSDIDSRIWCEELCTPTTGQPITHKAIGPLITAAAPAPAPPPAPTSTTRGPLISSFTSSGALTAVSGQTIEGLVFSGTGVHITVPSGVQNVLIQNCRFTSTTASSILVQGTGTVIRNCAFGFGASFRGILINAGTNTTIQYNTFGDFSLGSQFEGHAVENDYNNGPTLIDSNDFIGTNYKSDVCSNFQVSRVTLTNNLFTVQIDEPSGAAFTMGDGVDSVNRGRDNYIARNTINQTDGVPAGVFGSDGNTIIEFNCFTAGIQAYAYPNEAPGNFLGVTIRKNVINIGASFVPNTAVIAEWATNINSTNCALVPVS